MSEQQATALTPQQEVQQQEHEINVRFDRATIETVKRTVFPNSTDDELRIYLYKCVVVGAHPLSGKVIPVIFKDNSEFGGGSKRLSFITTIDLFRSQANESGEYDGQDEPEFSTETLDVEDGNDVLEVPVECKVKVYRKNIGRPFVGTARWKEFYPGHKRGHMWRKMPNTMLAKCAEAQAFRKAFPEHLNLMYAAEELDQAGDRRQSSKPEVAPTKQLPQSRPAAGGPTAANAPAPDAATRKAKKLISEAQERRLVAIAVKHNVTPDMLKVVLKVRYGYNHFWQVTWVNDQYKKLCAALEEKTDEVIAVYEKATAEAQQEDREVSFVEVASDLAAKAGMNAKKLDDAVNAEFGFDTIGAVPEDQENNIIDWLQVKVEEKEQAA